MDAERFDRLARRLADAHTRRSVLRALTGGTVGLLLGAAGVGQARAKNDASQFCKQLPPSQRGKCRTDAANGDPGSLFAQCDGDASRLCETAGGTFTCCDTAGACCGSVCVDLRSNSNCGSCGNACTGSSFCVNGGCCQASIGGACDPAGGCCTGLCRNGVCDYAGPGETCDTDADCSSFLCDEERERCSLLSSPGGPCESDLDCVDSVCNDGTCRAACIELGNPCSADDECCQDGPTSCANVSGPEDHACCHPLGGSCDSYTECCQDSTIGFVDCGQEGCCRSAESICDPLDDQCCHYNGQYCSYGANSATQEGEARCCVPNGGICAYPSNCCDNLDCQGNHCCGGAGDVQCSSDDECCPGVVCRGTVCCFPEGTACSFDSECCAGSACQNGVCTSVCVPLGESCATTEDCCDSAATCFDGVCRTCQQGSSTCIDGLSTTSVCCEPPGAALICCNGRGICDAQRCLVLCVPEEPADCDLAQTLCPATHPLVIALVGHVLISACNGLPAGATCQVDTDCVTAVCIDGVCWQTGAGGPCTDNADCTTGACSDGVCQP